MEVMVEDMENMEVRVNPTEVKAVGSPMEARAVVRAAENLTVARAAENQEAKVVVNRTVLTKNATIYSMVDAS